MSFLKFDQGAELKNFESVEYFLEVNQSYEALLYIDGTRMTSMDLNSIYLEMEHIESIMMQPFRGSRIYKVFTTENYKQNKVDLFDYHIVQNGYDQAKEYYTAIYVLENDRLKKWIELDRKPDVTTNSQGESFFKIPNNTAIKNKIFSVQGMTEKGGFLISETVRN